MSKNIGVTLTEEVPGQMISALNGRPAGCPPALWETMSRIVQNPSQVLREFPELIEEFQHMQTPEVQT